MKLVKCPDPDCGAYNAESDTTCQRCYASLGTKVHAREAKKNSNAPKKRKWDDEEEVDESLDNDRYKEHGRRSKRRNMDDEDDDSV